MRKLVFALFLTLCQVSFAFDRNVVHGQWAVYSSNWLSGPDYFFLAVHEDFSGVLVRSFRGEEIRRPFTAANVLFRDGYLEIQLNETEKTILSAWKEPSGTGKLTGQIFMYKKNGDLFNMLYFPLQLLQPGDKLSREMPIKELSNEFAEHR